jgi:hypothetical protein
MKKGQIVKGGTIPYSPVITENCFYPNADSTYTMKDYTGDRVVIPPQAHKYGIKSWFNILASRQGMAIYDDILVRIANVSMSTTHNIYQITSNGLTSVATFECNTFGHGNTCQFAPLVESGQTYPYLYVSDLDGGCEVFQIAQDFTVTQVQKITYPLGWQMQIGDDGYMWAITGAGTTLGFAKYRKVLVSEGATVALTTDDILESMTVEDKFPSAQYTFQGSKFKFGKAWIPIGTDGAAQKRALLVYDLAAKRTIANIDLTFVGDNVEFEDCDFYDGALIICTYKAPTYILRF